MRFWSFVLVIALVIAAALLAPSALLWATSVVFNVEVSYDFWHWLAAFALLFLLVGGSSA